MDSMTIQHINGSTVVALPCFSQMNHTQLQRMGRQLCRLIDARKCGRVVLDFRDVQYLSSQSIAILLTMYRKLSCCPEGSLSLCNVNDSILSLLQLTHLDRILPIRSSGRIAMAA